MITWTDYMRFPLETQGENVVPVTIHRTTRQQIAARLRSGRFKHV